MIILIIVCYGCNNKEVTIEPIGKGCYLVWGEDCDEKSLCPEELQYYTIDNYENLSDDSLYRLLNAHINSKKLYERKLECIKRDIHPSFIAFFYKKSLFVDYEKYIYDATRNEFFGIYEHKHKLVALIHSYYDNGVSGFETVLYNTSIMPWADTDIRWKKKDIIWREKKNNSP